MDTTERFYWEETDPIWRPMILAYKESYQVQLALNVSRSSYGWGTIVLNKAGKHRFFLRYINVEAYLPYEKRKKEPNFDEEELIVDKRRPLTRAELERKRKGPLMYRGIPVILGPYDVDIVEKVNGTFGALSKRTSTPIERTAPERQQRKRS